MFLIFLIFHGAVWKGENVKLPTFAPLVSNPISTTLMIEIGQELKLKIYFCLRTLFVWMFVCQKLSVYIEQLMSSQGEKSVQISQVSSSNLIDRLND
jgi:hypothetical protein